MTARKLKPGEVAVDRAEYEALKEATHAHESARLDAMRAREHYAACLSINKEQAARLNAQDLQLTDARRRADVAERECARLSKELDELRGKAAK